MSELKKIKICPGPNCGTPLLWTFIFAYNEYYCLNCGYKQGMFGDAADEPATKELQLKSDIVHAIWKQLYGKNRLLPPGEYGKSKCKKCVGAGRNHNSHLTKREIEWNKVAWEIFEQVKGIFNGK